MKALFTYGAEVPVRRVIAENRRWLVPVGVVLAINVIVLAGVVVPLRRSVENSAERAAASESALHEAMADFKEAEATRDGQSQAAKDLDKFYADVLPSSMTTARRITNLKLTLLARSHDVELQKGASVTESLRESSLERLHVNYSLTGDWDDIRQLIYEIETGADFVVIDNVELAEGQEGAALALTLDLSTYYRVGANGR